MYHNLELKEGAILISDIHFNQNRKEFEEFLNLIEIKKPPQLLLLGDIFDLLVGQIDYTLKINKNIIEKLNKLSYEMEIIYFEGNHDFNLKEIFKNIKIISLKNQPTLFKFKKFKLIFSHGDINIGFNYKVFSKIIRNRYILVVLNFVNGKLLKDKISKNIFNWLEKKSICKKFFNFEQFIFKRLSSFENLSNIDFLVEAHFHQGIEFKYKNLVYINMPSFACEKSFFIIKSTLESFSFFKANLRSFDVS